MSKKSKVQTEPFTLLLLTMVLTTLLILPQGILLSSASPAGTKYFLSVSPTRIQEGFNTSITVSLQEANISTTYTFKVNVTSPNGVSYFSNVTVITNETGAGSNLTEFWSDFAGANTYLVGTYNVTLFNIAGNETLATANFTVEGICEVQARNLAGEPLSDATVEVYDATSGDFINLSQTNETGWTQFLLGAGNYTFKAFWTHRGNDVKVGELNWTFSENVALPLNASLSNLKLTVSNATGAPIPFVNLNLSYNYTTRANEIIPETGSFTTNINGTVILQNVFANISYLIEAQRYGFPFNTTFIENLSAQGWNNVTIVAPTYTMFVNVLGAQNTPAADLRLLAYDWNSSQTAQQDNTDDNGNVTLSLTFGRYRLRLYKDDAFLKEVTVDLLNQSLNQYSFVVHIDVYKVDLSVLVVDYFGQPIPNVLVEFQCKVNSNYQTTETNTTQADGIARFNGIIGGNSRISVSVAGRPGETQYLYLVDSKQILFKLDGYVAVAGYALETSQFVTMVILLVTIVAFIIASTYKRLGSLVQRRKK